MIKASLAELIGTMCLVMFGCGAAIWTNNIVAIALAFGLTVIVMSVTVGRVSGAHLNPAVSLGMFLDKRIDAKTFGCYFVFQVIGAIIGAAVVYILCMGMSDAGLNTTAGLLTRCINHVDPIGTGYAIVAEIVVTMFFVLIALGATAKNGMDKFAGLYIGLGLTMSHLFLIPITGCSVNPARSIGAAVFGFVEDIDAAGDVWAFIIAPLIGAAIAFAIWKFVLSDEKTQ